MGVKSFVIGLLAIVVCSNAFSQNYPEVKVDTMEMRVSIVDFFNDTEATGLILDRWHKRVLIPTDSLDQSKLYGYLDESEVSNFNGVFFLSRDNFVLFSYPLTKYLGLNPDQFLNSMPDLPVNYNKTIKVPERSDKRVRAYTLDGIWVKYTLQDFLTSHESARKRYIKYVKGADNRSFNYYVLIKKNSYKDTLIY